MKFRTELEIAKSSFEVNYSSKLMAIGSCFADEIGGKLKKLKFDISVNPAEIIFNPHSIANLLENALNENVRSEHFVERDGTFFSFDFHSKVSASSSDELLSKISSIQNIIKHQIKDADVLFITFGTSWVYKSIALNYYVANCHKIAQQNFKKEILDLDVLVERYKILIDKLNKFNPKLKIVFTVSPVRHIKDGLHENNISKSILHLLIQKLMKNNFSLSYFPAYEFVIDDLRDYRFYKEDLIHPNEQAIDYVFEKFSKHYFSVKTQKGVDIQKQIMQLENHRSIINESNSHSEKLKKLELEFNQVKA